MNAGLFDVLHDAGDHNVFAIAQRVDIDLGRRFEKVIDQHRPVLRVLDRLAHVLLDRCIVVADHHGASAEHIRRPHQHGILNLLRIGHGFFNAGGGRARRLRDIEFLQQLAESFAVFRQIDVLGRGTDDGHARGLQAQCEIQRRLSAELHDDADLCSA